MPFINWENAFDRIQGQKIWDGLLAKEDTETF